ncbi:HAD family hydrolase [Nocardioides sp. Root190]|uniref:HAD-IIA family hydrolase n=1 Tax=Nocardioides sp. Root190 TaxID=1736488 RepID=UPI0007018358|nr:HAD-IIA family hydrolase [Nocardioides sp. Root190]KRB73796.1 HAD family hydrolase [Nocardioides sp. Root190]
MLLTSTSVLTEVYDLAMLDLDGVVYIGAEAVPGAAGHIAAARSAGMRIAFVTNNASRPPETVAQHLSDLGVSASASDVVTSAQAAARLARGRWGRGARVVCLGAPGLEQALVEAGLVPVGVEEEAVGLVSGYGPDLRWSTIMRAAVLIGDGLPWVASNTDQSIPTAFGVAPGHGVLVEMVSRFTGVVPVVAGKPERPLLDETVRRVGGARPLMIGDRLDTDIEGARNAGVDSLLVLTGVTGLGDLVAAPVPLRPSYLSANLAGLFDAHVAPTRVEDRWVAGGWSCRVAKDGRIEMATDAARPDAAQRDDWWRAVAAAAWDHLDRTGSVVDITAARVPAPDPSAR